MAKATKPHTVAGYFHAQAEGGRAVLAYSAILGHETEPLLWICRVDGAYVVVDEAGPETEATPWEGFYVEVPGRMLVAEVQAQYAAHWVEVLEARREARTTAQWPAEEVLKEV